MKDDTPHFFQRGGSHGVEVYERDPFSGPSGAGPSGPEGTAAQMPPNDAGRLAGLGGPSFPQSAWNVISPDNADAIDTLPPSGPHPIPSAPSPGGSMAVGGDRSYPNPLAKLARAVKLFFGSES